MTVCSELCAVIFLQIIQVCGWAFSSGTGPLAAFQPSWSIHNKPWKKQSEILCYRERLREDLKKRQIRTGGGREPKCKRNTATFSERLNCDQSSEV